jgi:hypothetical protein
VDVEAYVGGEIDRSRTAEKNVTANEWWKRMDGEMDGNGESKDAFISNPLSPFGPHPVVH